MTNARNSGAKTPQSGKNAGLNIQDVADAAGVSKTTVSHVLTGNRPVSAATRRKVEQVMDELGYKPNFFAQALNSQKSQTIALIAQDFTNPFYPALARGVQIAVAGSSQVVMLFDAGAGESAVSAFIDDAIQRRVDGVILAVSAPDSELIALRKEGIAVVAVGSGLSRLPLDWVTADDERIGYDAGVRLVSAGHTQIATITGPLGAEPGTGRRRGFERALVEAGLALDPALVIEGDWTRDQGAAGLRALLANDEPPTAVFCANDLMAIGALDAAVGAGLDVPEQLALIGVDDIDAAGLVRPALTTIQIPAQEIGRAAGELLLQRMAQGEASSHRHILVQHQLITRQTV